MDEKPIESFDTRDAGLQIGNILGKFFLKTEHLHYGYWDNSLEVSLDNLEQAQKNYSTFLLSNIPENVHSILDVGCGVGENARLMIQKGYQVDCVSPSSYLSKKTKEKIGDNGHIFECFFEDIETTQKYDMILFSESFQYIKMDPAFKKCQTLLNPGGFILISDFFKIPAEGESPLGGGHKLPKFFNTIKNFPFFLLKDIDITENTKPNFELVDKVLREVVIPIQQIIDSVLSIRYAMLYKISNFFARLFFKKKMDKLKYKYLSGSRNAENFAKYKTYRLFLLQYQDDSKSSSDAMNTTTEK